MSRLLRTLRRPLSSRNHPVFVGLTDGALFLALALGVIAGPNALRTPHTIDLNSSLPYLTFGAAFVAVMTGVLTNFFIGQMTRSMPRTIASTAAVMALMMALVWVLADRSNPQIDANLSEAMILFGLMGAPFGYRLFGFRAVKADNTATAPCGALTPYASSSDKK